MAKILVIDPGSYSVKTVLLTRDWNTVRIIDYSCHRVSGSGNISGDYLAGIVEALRTRTDQRIDDTYLVIPSQNLFFRNLNFVFSQRRKIEKILPLQLETILPLTREHFVSDFILTGHRENGEYEAFSAICKKSDLQSHIDLFKTHEIKLRGIRIGAAGLATMAAQVGKEHPGNTMIIDMGNTSSSIIILESGVLRYTRVIYWGAASITRVVQDELNLTDGDAEQIMRNVDLTSRSKTENLHDVIARGCHEGLGEIQETLNYYREKLRGNPVQVCYLCGGGALTPGITGLFERSLTMPCEMLGDTLNNALVGGMEQKDISTFLPAISAGYSVLKAPGRRSMELMRGEFQPTGSLRTHRGQITVAGILAFVLLILYLYSLQATINLKKNQAGELRQFMNTILTRNFASEIKIVNPLIQMQSLVQEERGITSSNQQNGSPGYSLPVNILQSIHEKIPTDVSIMLTELQIDQKRVFMVGETASFESISKIKSAMESLPFFGESIVTSEKLQGKTSTIKFTLKIPLIEPVEKEGQP